MPSAGKNRTASARFKRGAGLGTPIFLGYLPVGMAFGVLATTIGFTVFQATLCSATAFAGAGQFITLSMMRAGEAALAVVAATTVVNLRHVLFAATLAPYVRGLPAQKQAPIAFTLTDETFAINVSDCRQGRATGWSMLGVGAIAWTGWVLGTLIGATAAGWIGDPSAWGLDYAMPAMFTVLFIALAENRRQVIVGLGAAMLALGIPLLADVGVVIAREWIIILSSMVAATLGAVFFDE